MAASTFDRFLSLQQKKNFLKNMPTLALCSAPLR
jgi:hypothetical protein